MGTRYDKEKSREEDQRIQREIEAGHIYVNLHCALGHTKDEAQARDIRLTMAGLYEESGYLRSVLEAYGPYRRGDALSFLASRSSRNYKWDSLLVLNRDMQDKSESYMSHSIRKESLCS